MGDGTSGRVLIWAGVLYAVGTLVHTADHLRRGVDTITLHVSVAGYLGTGLAVVALALIFLRHPSAPLAAVAVGFPHGLGIAAVHYAPEWSAFSDSFIGSDLGPLSWAAVSLEVAGALAVGVAGLHALRATATNGGRQSEVRAA